MGWLRPTGSAALVAVALSGVASAHDPGTSRFDAPLPLPLLFVGAGATVAVTAFWLGTTERTQSTGGRRWQLATVPPSIATGLRATARSVFFALFVAALFTGLVGKQAPAGNFATVFVWPVWIKGVGLLAILAGSPWGVLSPWRTLYDLLTSLEGREIALLGEYPSWLGSWPALAGFLVGIGVLENLTVVPRSPRATVFVIASYALFTFLGAVAYGYPWLRRADALAVLYRLFGRVAPIRFVRTEGGGYRVDLRPPWRECTEPIDGPALVVFVVATVYTVSFDGFTNTREFQTVLFAARDLFGVGPVATVGLYLLGLSGFVGGFVAVSWLAQRAARGTGRGWKATTHAFASTVLPIAVAYELAHNYPFVIRNLGQAITLLPDVANTSNGQSVALLGWLSLPLFWASQAVLVVVGHVVAVMATHYVAIDRYGGLGDARRGHLPLVALMVGYTVLSLWIISRPVVSG